MSSGPFVPKHISETHFGELGRFDLELSEEAEKLTEEQKKHLKEQKAGSEAPPKGSPTGVDGLFSADNFE